MKLQYQDFLLDEFRSRRSRNPSYSLRAYARDLDMPASKLSQNLRGLCGISRAKAEKISNFLGMRDDEKQLFLALVESQHARSRVAREQASVALQKIREEKLGELSLEKFTAIRDWHHFAILEMTDIKGFKSDIKWMADRLALPAEMVKQAVERLISLDLLKWDGEDLRQTFEDLEIPGGVPSRTIREHHKQILTKAAVALDQVQVDRREFSSHTFAIDSSVLPQAKEMMRDLHHRLSKLAHQGHKDSVYVVSMQLFPMVEVEK